MIKQRPNIKEEELYLSVERGGDLKNNPAPILRPVQGLAGESNASSDNDQDELIEDTGDIGPDGDVYGEADGEGDNNDNDDDNGDEEQDVGGEEEDFLDQSSLSQLRTSGLPITINSSDDTPTLGHINGAGPTSHPHPP